MSRQHYHPAEIEPRWQQFWAEHKMFRTLGPGDAGFDASKPKYYVLDMFPYPSGTGLHVGHPEGYTATDILARWKRMCGFNVLHPMGWDAFGLPAEQFAIQTGTHPEVSTQRNIDTFRRQIRALGFSYDWDRELSTCDPRYYKWTQWIFKQLHQRGLAYLAEVPVWWCEALGTVLSNDEVIDGKSERGGHPCVRVPMKQWMLRITSYAQRLLDDLEELDFPESLKAMQREWIGRSEGAEVDFPVLDAVGKPSGRTIRVFTTRPDTLFGATYMVVSPEHPLLRDIASPGQRAAVTDYCEQAARKSELDRTELAKEKTGVFTGAYAHNPVFPADDPRARIPIWTADYVIMSYGTGAIMAVPGGDLRDHEFARKFGIRVQCIVDPDFSTGDQGCVLDSARWQKAFQSRDAAALAELRAAILAGAECWTAEGRLIQSSNAEVSLDGCDVAQGKQRIIAWLVARGLGQSKVTFRIRDWLFSRQRYWGEPFPVVYGGDGSVELVADGELPVVLPPMDDFKPSGRAEAPLAKARDWVAARTRDGRQATRDTNTMPGSAGSSWYFLRYCDPHNDRAAFDPEKVNYWLPVDLYLGGAEHAVGHLLYARFWHKVLFDMGLVRTKEPFQRLFNQGMIQSYGFRTERGEWLPCDEVEERDGGFFHKPTGQKLVREVAKMSKRLKNVVNPDDVLREYGADTFRLYEMFMGPLDQSKPWNPADLPGVHRFLSRVWRLVVPEYETDGPVHAHLKDTARAGAEAVERSLHKTIKKVTEDLGRMAFNTAIAAMMVHVNEATKAGAETSRDQMLRFVQLLGPFAPHVAEELWQRLGKDPAREPLSWQQWPRHDERMLVEDSVELAVQVLGKLRGKVVVPVGAPQDAVVAAARDAVARQLEGKQVVKEIYVPGKLVNFVVKG